MAVADFTMERVVVTFTPETSPLQINLNISITDDEEGEPLERFDVTITSTDSRVRIIGGRVTIIIQDNEGIILIHIYLQWLTIFMSTVYRIYFSGARYSSGKL